MVQVENKEQTKFDRKIMITKTAGLSQFVSFDR